MTALGTDSRRNLTSLNEFGQPVGCAMKNWSPPPFLPHQTLRGRYCQLEPLKSSVHTQDIWEAQSEDVHGARWTYMFSGPFKTLEQLTKWSEEAENSLDPQFYAIVVDEKAVGVVSYMRIVPSHGAVEVGHIYYSPQLAKTRSATEAMYLLAENAFKLGYRCYE